MAIIGSILKEKYVSLCRSFLVGTTAAVVLGLASGAKATLVTYQAAGDISIVQQQTQVFPFGPNTTFTATVSYDDVGPYQSILTNSHGADYHNGLGSVLSYADIVINLKLLDHDSNITYDYSRSYHLPRLANGSALYSIGDVQVYQNLPGGTDLFAVSLDNQGSRNDLPAYRFNQAQEDLDLRFRGAPGMVPSTDLVGLMLNGGKIQDVTINYSLQTSVPGGTGLTPLGNDSFVGIVTSFSVSTAPEPATFFLACGGAAVGAFATPSRAKRAAKPRKSR